VGLRDAGGTSLVAIGNSPVVVTGTSIDKLIDTVRRYGGMAVNVTSFQENFQLALQACSPGGRRASCRPAAAAVMAPSERRE